MAKGKEALRAARQAERTAINHLNEAIGENRRLRSELATARRSIVEQDVLYSVIARLKEQLVENTSERVEELEGRVKKLAGERDHYLDIVGRDQKLIEKIMDKYKARHPSNEEGMDAFFRDAGLLKSDGMIMWGEGDVPGEPRGSTPYRRMLEKKRREKTRRQTSRPGRLQP